MVIDEKPLAGGETGANPKDRVTSGPVPPWVNPLTYDLAFQGKEIRHITHLLFSRQEHAEHRQAHFHSAVRLESMEAVQRNSQWSVNFQPRYQTISVHWIKIRRGEQEFNQASLEKFRLLEREEGLERLVIDGHFTLLLVLEDVRAGDVIESCYTIETKVRLLPGNHTAFFALPQGVPVGKYYFSLRFSGNRPMQWKSSGTELTPVQNGETDERAWVWSGENYEEKPPEANTPTWYLAHPWIQVSDCPDWGMVSAAVAEAWQENADDAAVSDLLAEITAGNVELIEQVERAIQLVQDGFRYLSVNLDFGGQIPQPPGVVIRKRYGDCKDLAFLLVHLLKRLGLVARPVLVHTQLRKSVGEMLPMAWFNHVVVEFVLQGQTRWVDAVIKHQGGGPLNRCIPDYRMGLAVDGQPGAGLIAAPPVSAKAHLFELKETILLDTTGAPSQLAVLLRARGFHADGLRQQFGAQGAGEVARGRQTLYTNRFSKAERVGVLETRDDRAANEFTLAEVFAISGFLQADPRPAMSKFVFPANLVVSTLAMPAKEPRRTPYALPFPCNLVHILEINTTTQKQNRLDRLPLSNEFLIFNRVMEMRRGWMILTLNLSTLAEAVPASRLGEYRTKLEDIWKTSSWHFICPAGHSHPVKRASFGLLPPLPRAPAAVLPGTSAPVPAAVNRELGTVNTPEISGSGRSSSRSRRRGPGFMTPEDKLMRYLLRLGLVVLVMVIIRCLFW